MASREAVVNVNIGDLPQIKEAMEAMRSLLHDIAVARRGDSPDVDENWDRLPDEIRAMRSDDELLVPYFPLAAALGRALDHESLEFQEVIVELNKVFPQFAWRNAMTDG